MLSSFSDRLYLTSRVGGACDVTRQVRPTKPIRAQVASVQVTADGMGKLQKFEILFDNNKTEYSSGDSVSGSVKVELSGPLPCKGTSLLTWRSATPNAEVACLHLLPALHGNVD